MLVVAAAAAAAVAMGRLNGGGTGTIHYLATEFG